MNKAKLLLLGFVVVILFVAVLPAAAAPGATITSIVLNQTTCVVTLTFTVEDAGNYYVNVWDDGTFQTGAGVFIPAGGTGVATIGLGVVLQGATGVGIYVEDGLGPAATTTFDSRGSFNDLGPCGVSGTYSSSLVVGGSDACANPQPVNYIVRPVPGGAVAYWAPEADKTTNFTLPAGHWYTSPEPTDGFYEVWIACAGNHIFIPIENVG